MQNKSKNQLISNALSFGSAIIFFISLIVYIIIRVPSDNFDINRIFSYSNLLWIGITNTIIIGVYSLLFGLILGFVLYLARESSIYFIKSLSNIFIELIMGTPLIVLVFVTTFFIGKAFNIDNNYFLGLISLTAYIGPYMANMFKSAIDSIDKQQYIIMDLYAFSPYHRYRYIIIPQILRLLMPPLMNNFSYTIKGSSLLSLTTVPEIYYFIKNIQSETFAFTEGYLVLWGAYLALTLPLTLLTKYIEKRFAL